MNPSTAESSAPLSDLMKHPATIEKSVLDNGAFKLYTDVHGYAQLVEISVPEGRVIIIKDYEEVPALAHYQRAMVLSPKDLILGSLNIVPEDRRNASSMSHFFDVNNSVIGTGYGDIGMAIASQLLDLPQDPRQEAITHVDPSVITSIKAFLEDKK